MSSVNHLFDLYLGAAKAQKLSDERAVTVARMAVNKFVYGVTYDPESEKLIHQLNRYIQKRQQS